MVVLLCCICVGLISHPLSACGWLGRRQQEITGRSCTGSMSLTCSEKGNGGWGLERKCTYRPIWNTRWQEVGRRPLKLTPGLFAEMASTIDLASDGREESQVPPQGPQTTQIYYRRRGESRLVPRLTAPGHFKVNWLHPVCLVSFSKTLALPTVSILDISIVRKKTAKQYTASN